MAAADLQKFSPASAAHLSHALRIRRSGAYAFVAYATSRVHWQNLEVRGFQMHSVSTQDGVNQYQTLNKIATRRRGPKPPPPAREVRGRFFVAKLLTPDAYVFVTPERDEYVRDGLARFLYRARGFITRARLTSAEMWDIVHDLLTVTKARVVTSRSLLRNKRHEATISYKAESLPKVYEYARESDANVHGFDFSLIGKEGDVIVRAGINRDGKLSFQGGSSEFFLKHFVETVAMKVKLRADLLKNRARKEHTGDVRPLRLKFDNAPFARNEDIRAFLTVLTRVRHGEFTLFHRNPYLHLSFFDFFDASEFDLIIEGVDSLVIVPQFESTSSSLFRLCQKIFERFEEGTVTDAPDVVTTSTLPVDWDD